jgi:hypothetical protein
MPLLLLLMPLLLLLVLELVLAAPLALWDPVPSS